MMSVKINHDYFTLNTRAERLRNFLAEGHVLAHCLDRAQWYLGPKLGVVFPFPTHVDIETSSLCQMRCPMCMTHLMTQPRGNMPYALFTRLIDQCVAGGVYSVKLSWRGEPLLNPRIVDMVRYAKERGIREVAFLTNGERLTEALAEALVGAGLDWLSISFDGYDKQTYEGIRRPAVFETTIAMVQHLRAARERRGQRKPLIRVQSVFAAIEKDPQRFRDLWRGIADRINFIATEDRASAVKQFKHDPEYICQSPWQRLCVMWDGRVPQCHSDYCEGNILGDANTQTLREIWHGAPFTELRRLMRGRQRLRTAPCRLCCDGGVTEKDRITVDGREIEIVRYTDQAGEPPRDGMA
ncbi:MAG TPA: radical SAM protein [bacterium]|nr:radical SAM protein [bacterium]